uniref:Uncharacterized protein n=1 Tax=Phaeophyceae sp. TaxID=2249243 RepID=A0A8E8PES7_9PHAE|nr:hypothetical protein [Phaeophyceae sp.]
MRRFTQKKRHLRKKRFYLPGQHTFAIFNASNLKTSKVVEVNIKLYRARLYTVPLYLTPPKISRGCTILMLVCDNVEDLQKNLDIALPLLNCLGISIKNEWYSPEFYKETKVEEFNIKILSLLLKKELDT